MNETTFTPDDLRPWRDNPTLDYMLKYNRPLDRETYIAIATMGLPEDYQWTHEDEVDMPEPFRLKEDGNG